MRIRYTLSDDHHEFDATDSEDLATLCGEIEERLRSEHPELAGAVFLAERIADGILNSLAAAGPTADPNVDLGELS